MFCSFPGGREFQTRGIMSCLYKNCFYRIVWAFPLEPFNLGEMHTFFRWKSEQVYRLKRILLSHCWNAFIWRGLEDHNRTVNCVRDRGHALIKNSVNSWQRRPECLVCIPKTQSSFIIWSLVIAKSAVEDFKGKLDNCKLSEICNISRRHSVLRVLYLSCCAELSLRNCFPVILPGIIKT